MGSVIVDQSGWDLVRVSGGDRVRFMQGMVIGDIAKVDEGGWIRTAMLSPKGRVMSTFDLAVSADEFVLICEPGRGQPTIELLSKYAIMDDVEFESVKRSVHRVWTDPAAVWTAPPVWQAPSAASSEADVECRRIEAGMPRYGVDVGEANFPFESPLADLIDYEKGCYIGQEPVHRVHAKGQPSKGLRGLSFESDDVPEVGATVVHPERDNAGAVTSAVRSPDFGVIALALLHRSAANAGDKVTCGGQMATVVDLPFGG